MILQKCCHDMDLYLWLADKKCKSLSSFGSTYLFKEENAPEGCTKRCLDGCKVKATCPYDAESIYLDSERIGARNGNTRWPLDVVTEIPTPESVEEALKTGPYGRCVYHCDNDVVDHQVVNLNMTDGSTMSFSMNGHTAEYFLPSVTMSAAVAMVWKWMYNEQMGILNSALKAVGGKGHNWMTDPHTALFGIMVVGLWMTVGYNMIILLAGMQGISKSYYEAAAIDGAGAVTQFFKITIPMLTPTVFFVMITSIISGFQVFDTVYMMVGKANPAYESTQTVVMLFYRQAFDYGHKGYAAAISILIFLAIMLVTVIQMIGQKKWVNYD